MSDHIDVINNVVLFQMHDNLQQLLVVFGITALWDVILRSISLGILHIPIVSTWKWIKVLKPYFEHHTLLAAALLAGVAGVGAQAFLWLLPPTTSLLIHTLEVLIASVLVGGPMYMSGLYPVLNRTYYDKLGAFAMVSDGLSGLIVMTTIYILQRLLHEDKVSSNRHENHPNEVSRTDSTPKEKDR